MGIDNLLNFVKPALKQSSIVNYRGQKAAVDTMSWLYKGCYSCAHELNQNIQTNDYLYFVQKMINMLQEYNITPILVFDGRKLKAKEKTEQFRKSLKVQNLTRAQELQAEGNLSEAKRYYQRSLKITKQMLYTTFDVLTQLQIEFIVSPYEADAQLAHLCLSGYCDFAITEDVFIYFFTILKKSDLICYQCPKIIYKLQLDGSCQELDLEQLRTSQQYRRELISDKSDGDVRVFFGLKGEQFVDSCIMSGCDYLPSIKGIGIRKCVEYLNKLGNSHNVINKLLTMSTFKDKIPKDYEKILKTIRLIFLYQIVYDPIQKKQLPLNSVQFSAYFEDIQKQAENLENVRPQDQVIVFTQEQIAQIIGETLGSEISEQFTSGELDFKTLQKREKVKIDFKKLFTKFQRRSAQNPTQIKKQVDVSQSIQNFQNLKEQGYIYDLGDQIDFIPDHKEYLEEQFMEIKVNKDGDQDIFGICEDLVQEFEHNQITQQHQHVRQDEYNEEEEYKTEIKNQQEGDQEEYSSGSQPEQVAVQSAVTQLNPFAVEQSQLKSQTKVRQSLNQVY